MASVSYHVHILLLESNASDWKTRQIKACMDPCSHLNAVLMIWNKDKCYPGKCRPLCGQTHPSYVSKIPSPADLGPCNGCPGWEIRKQQDRSDLPVKLLWWGTRKRKRRGKKKAKEILWERSGWIFPLDFAEIRSLLTIPTTKSNSHPSHYLNAPGSFPTS